NRPRCLRRPVALPSPTGRVALATSSRSRPSRIAVGVSGAGRQYAVRYGVEPLGRDPFTAFSVKRGPLHTAGGEMRLMRVGPVGAERPTAWAGPGLGYDLSEFTDDIDGEFLASDRFLAAQAAVRAGRLPEVNIAGQRVGAP